jgi:hypothetical protein
MSDQDAKGSRPAGTPPWISIDPSLASVIKAIEREVAIHSDRGTAVIAGGLIDTLLMDALKSRLRYAEGPAQAKKDLFGINMPLSTPYAKINLGVFLGLYRTEVWNDLRSINTIRNRFAHKLECNNFTSPLVKPLCDSLWIPDNLFIVESKTPLAFGISGETPSYIANRDKQPKDEPPQNARDMQLSEKSRFILAVKLLVAVLVRAAKHPETPPDPLWG